MDRVSARQPSIHRIWPLMAIGFGFGLSAVWICFLGYELVKIVEAAI
jgi:hypothetical protein